MQRTPLANRWATERWEPIAVEPTAAEARAVARVPGVELEQWRFSGFDVELHRSEGEGFFLNLSSPGPRAFVMWRPLEPEARAEDGPPVAPFLVTLSYNEAARMLDGGEQVDSVPLAPELLGWLEAFTAAHYVPEPKRKIRRRDPLNDEALEPGRSAQESRPA